MNIAGRPAIGFTYRLGQDPLPAAGGPQMVYTLLEFTPAGEGSLAMPAPLNICLVLDVSLSMRGEKIERVREAARHVFGQLGSRDALSIVSFHDRATVVLPAKVAPPAPEVEKAIEGLVSRGGTELAAGLKAGIEELLRGRSMTGRPISSMLVLTDGRTYGDEARCLELAEQARRQELLITPLGVGDEWNEDLLEALAYRCGSHSEYIDRPEAIVDAFRQHVTTLRHISGRQAQLTLRTGPDTRLAQIHRVGPLIGRVEQLPGPNVSAQRFALGNLMSGETQSLLLEVILPAVSSGVIGIVDGALDWKATDSRQGEATAEFAVSVPVDPHAGPAPTLDAAVKMAVEKVVAYKLQKRAWQDLQEGNVAQATTKLRMVATRLLAAGEPELARTVQAEADHLEKNGFVSGPGTKQIKYGTRGLGRTRSMRAPEQARS